MKKFMTLTLSGIFVTLIGLGCVMGDIFPPENIKYETANGIDGQPGGGLRFTWSPYSDSVGISVDGVLAAAVSSASNEAYVYMPGTHIEVSAIIAGQMEGYSRSFDLPLIDAWFIDVYSVNDTDPNHPSGFGFDTNGTCTSYSISDQVHHPDIDFFIGVKEDSMLCIVSPHLYTPDPINDKHNSTCQVSTSCDSLKIVPPATSENFSYETPIQNNGVYAFWLDDDGAPDTSSRFGKIFVTGIDGYKITLRLFYQPVPGLRWVVN